MVDIGTILPRNVSAVIQVVVMAKFALISSIFSLLFALWALFVALFT